VANTQTRTLSLHNIHTKEDLTITYKRNGRFDDAALDKLNLFMRDWRREESTKMDPELFDMLWEVVQESGGSTIHVVCGYRSPATNAMLRRRSGGVAENSQHTQGKAIDFFIPDAPLEKVRAAGLRLQGGGVGYYPTSGSPFVHMDTGSIRHWPRMTRDQLARVFPDGRTVHVPTDGNPLAGHAQAAAELQRRGGGAGTLVASESSGKPGFFAKLLGAKDEDEDEDKARAAPGPRRVASASAVVEDAQDKAAVPLPRPRPSARPAGTEVASAVNDAPVARPPSNTFALASASPNAAQIVQARGIWGGVQPRDEDLRPPQSIEPRLAWTVGPAGRSPAEHAAAERKSAERPRSVALASAGDITASLPPWPERNDKVPSEMVLAYAAAGPAETIVRPTAAASTMRLSSPAKPAPPRRALQTLSQQDPWLRGLVLSPSIKTSMGVAALGAPDYRTLTSLLHKPRNLLPVKFAAVMPSETSFDRFQGKAVEFPDTVRFGATVTARAN
jgi:uncharacterized protein YcbK (DUF882 family)